MIDIECEICGKWVEKLYRRQIIKKDFMVCKTCLEAKVI